MRSIKEETMTWLDKNCHISKVSGEICLNDQDNNNDEYSFMILPIDILEVLQLEEDKKEDVFSAFYEWASQKSGLDNE